MIISNALIRYLHLVRTEALHAEVYRLDDPVIRRYEILREYARADLSSQKLNELANRYEITAKTIKNYLEAKRKGSTIALFIEPLTIPHDLISSELEKKIVILNRGGETQSNKIVKTLNQIDPSVKSRGLTNRHINRVLRSHGLLAIQGLEDVNFQMLQGLITSFVRFSKKPGRRALEQFDDPKDPLQRRLEMFRAVYHPEAGEDKKSVVVAAKMCGISKAQFFNIKKLFLRFGVLGLLTMSRGRVTKHKLTPEIERKIVHQAPKSALSGSVQKLVFRCHALQSRIYFLFGLERLVGFMEIKGGIKLSEMDAKFHT